MADGSSIEWTQARWNPTTGCDTVSAGYYNCYALTLAKRLKAMGANKYQHDGDPRTSGCRQDNPARSRKMIAPATALSGTRGRPPLGLVVWRQLYL